MRLVGPDGQEAGVGTPGRLLVRTPNMMIGYWNDTLRSHQALGTGWLDTQDILKVDEDGYYWFLGRASEVIVRTPERTLAQVIEALGGASAVEEAALVGIPDPVAGQAPVASTARGHGRRPRRRGPPRLGLGAGRYPHRGTTTGPCCPDHVSGWTGSG